MSTHPPKSYHSINTDYSTPVPPAGDTESSDSHQGQEDNTNKMTADDILNNIGFGPFQVVAFLLVSFTYFCYALDASIFVFLTDSIMDDFDNLTDTQYTALPATTGVANVIGALFFSYATDRFGRVWPFGLCLIWVGLASVASAFANSFPLLIVLRLTASLGIGGISGLTFPTLVEFLPVRNRGKMGVLVLLVASLGIAASSGLAWWLIPTYSHPENGFWQGWRFYVIACGAPMLLIGLFRFVFYFESPRFLLTKGKTKQAWKVFRAIAKFNCKELTNHVSYEDFKEVMEDDAQQTKKKKFVFLQLLEIFKPRYLRRTLPLTVIIITESFGYLCSQLFLPEFVKKLDVNQYFVILISAIAQSPGVLLMSIIIEWPKVGRLNSLRFFSILSSIFFMLLAIFQTEVSIPVLVVFIYFSASPIISLLYTYISEVYPTEIRSVTTAYYYMLQAMSYLVGAFISDKASHIPLHWLFPAVWSIIFLIQFLAGLLLNYEPLNKKLFDVL